jgi:multidrug efflux system membrane fusion protein
VVLPSSAHRGRGFSIFFSLALTLGLAACSSGEGQAAASQGAAAGRGRGDGAPVPVATAAAVEKSMPVSITAVGTAEAIATAQVRSQVTGRLASVHFAEGQDVAAGQLLFTIDPQPFQVALDQASAILARDSAQANNAQVQADRYENLFKRGLIARDQYETQAASATAQKATMAADEAAIAAARLNLQYTKIVAPAAGRTGALLAHEGDLVQANVTAPLVVINQVAPIYVTFPIPGKTLDDIRRFQRSAALTVVARPAGGEQAGLETGKLTFIDNTVDPQTGTIKLKATFGNQARRLWPGQFAEITLQLRDEPRAIVVPSVAVQSSQQGPFVFIVTDGRAQMRQVTVARVAGDESVIGSGLAAGEVVVTDGQLRLTPNARIAQRGAGAGGGGRGGRSGAEAQ